MGFFPPFLGCPFHGVPLISLGSSGRRQPCFEMFSGLPVGLPSPSLPPGSLFLVSACGSVPGLITSDPRRGRALSRQVPPWVGWSSEEAIPTWDMRSKGAFRPTLGAQMQARGGFGLCSYESNLEVALGRLRGSDSEMRLGVGLPRLWVVAWVPFWVGGCEALGMFCFSLLGCPRHGVPFIPLGSGRWVLLRKFSCLLGGLPSLPPGSLFLVNACGSVSGLITPATP